MSYGGMSAVTKADNHVVAAGEDGYAWDHGFTRGAPLAKAERVHSGNKCRTNCGGGCALLLDAVAVSLAAKRKTDGCGFSAAVRNPKLLDL